jgi:predicted nucleotidyltransferase
MPAKIKRLLGELKQGLAHLYGEKLKSVYLYGSYVRGDYESGSDVDVMIVLSHYERYGDEIERTGELVSNLSLEYGLTISRILITEDQWKQSDIPLLRNIRREGMSA